MDRRDFLKSGAAALLTPSMVDPDWDDEPGLPSFEEMTDGWSEDKMVLAVEGDGWRAVCGPEAESDPDARDQRIGPAPFPFKVASKESVQPDDKVVAAALEKEFMESVDRLWEMIEDADDPLEAILELSPEDVTGGDNNA